MSRRASGLLLLVLGLAACNGAPASPEATSPASIIPTGTPQPTAPGPTGVATAAPTPAPSLVAGTPACAATDLAARITAWDNGAGNRFAHVEVTNVGAGPCRLKALDRPQLVDAHGSVLIDGAPPASSPFLTLAAGGVLSTDLDTANYCGPDPVAPVTVAFVLPGGTARFVATPLTPTDTSGVPPCNGNPGSAGDITMTGWKA